MNDFFYLDHNLKIDNYYEEFNLINIKINIINQLIFNQIYI